MSLVCGIRCCARQGRRASCCTSSVRRRQGGSASSRARSREQKLAATALGRYCIKMRQCRSRGNKATLLIGPRLRLWLQLLVLVLVRERACQPSLRSLSAATRSSRRPHHTRLPRRQPPPTRNPASSYSTSSASTAIRHRTPLLFTASMQRPVWV